MKATEILLDAAHRPLDAAQALPLTAELLNAHPGGHDNSIAWLLWHTAKEIDSQVADLSGAEPVWTRGGLRERFGLGEVGETGGYGHTSEQARSIVVTDPALAVEYVRAATAELSDYIRSLDDADLEEVIDASWDPPVTRGARLVSIIDDAAQHMGQAGYAAGVLDQG